jgi:hypothetical protein
MLRFDKTVVIAAPLSEVFDPSLPGPAPGADHHNLQPGVDLGVAVGRCGGAGGIVPLDRHQGPALPCGDRLRSQGISRITRLEVAR